jgi:type III secretion protein J
MTRALRIAFAALVALALTGCKVDLYGNLPEAEANQMLALLMLHHVDAEKQVSKGETATIRVERAQFVNAVELLRQNGLPRRKTASIEDLFPSGQLVTSPAQEQAKITYLREQQLEKMLRGIDGVITAQVAIAQEANPERRTPAKPSASVFIKFSPERNLENRQADVRALVLKSVPNLDASDISVVMQSADYRYLQNGESAEPKENAVAGAGGSWFARHRMVIVGVLLAWGAIGAGIAGWFAMRRRKDPS